MIIGESPGAKYYFNYQYFLYSKRSLSIKRHVKIFDEYFAAFPIALFPGRALSTDA